MPTNNLTNNDLQAISDLLEKQTAVLATKEDLESLRISTKQDFKELKEYMLEGFETVTSGINEITEDLFKEKRIERIEEWAKKAGDKIGIKPDL